MLPKRDAFTTAPLERDFDLIESSELDDSAPEAYRGGMRSIICIQL
jgi:hypothetical protein